MLPYAIVDVYAHGEGVFTDTSFCSKCLIWTIDKTFLVDLLYLLCYVSFKHGHFRSMLAANDYLECYTLTKVGF